MRCENVCLYVGVYIYTHTSIQEEPTDASSADDDNDDDYEI
jgi:hypothetical protein